MTLTFDPKNILTQYTKLTETLDTRDTMYRIPDNKRISSNELEKSEKMSPPPGIFEIS